MSSVNQKVSWCLTFTMYHIEGNFGREYSETSDKGHSERGQTSQQNDKWKVLLYTHSVKISPLKEDKLSTVDKATGPKGVLY